jgi:hypothetical protein
VTPIKDRAEPVFLLGAARPLNRIGPLVDVGVGLVVKLPLLVVDEVMVKLAHVMRVLLLK